MAENDSQRVRARVVRVGPHTAHIAIDAFASGQITIPVPTPDLVHATGLTRCELAGAELTVMANVSARTDTDVDPHDWQMLAPAGTPPATRPTASSAVAA